MTPEWTGAIKTPEDKGDTTLLTVGISRCPAWREAYFANMGCNPFVYVHELVSNTMLSYADLARDHLQGGVVERNGSPRSLRTDIAQGGKCYTVIGILCQMMAAFLRRIELGMVTLITLELFIAMGRRDIPHDFVLNLLAWYEDRITNKII